VADVGRPAGKSTISRLLFRSATSPAADPDRWPDIRNWSDVAARFDHSAAGYRLFNDTIRYNIRYGRWDASDAEAGGAFIGADDAFIRCRRKGMKHSWRAWPELSGGEK
jgi:ATP-binding cassette subfamily B protein